MTSFVPVLSLFCHLHVSAFPCHNFPMKMINRIVTSVSRVATLFRAIDIRDILVFGGLGLLGYGLWLLRPWLGFAVAGAVLMGIGYLMRDE